MSESPIVGWRREHGCKPTDIHVVYDLSQSPLSSLRIPWLVAGRVGDAGTSLFTPAKCPCHRHRSMYPSLAPLGV